MGSKKTYSDGSYWAGRRDMMYYRYFEQIIRIIGRDAQSMLDVGSGNAPYLECFNWIPMRVSIDKAPPHRSPKVQGVQSDFLEHRFDRRFDIVSCMQVLEHVREASDFAHRLMETGRVVLISVPYKWPRKTAIGHVNDPVDEEKLRGWFGRDPNWSVLVPELFNGTHSYRLFAIYDVDDPAKVYTREMLPPRRRPRKPPPPGIRASLNFLFAALRRRLGR